jgi:molybdopterin-guanine dinucleotide biosynthesis protein A
VASDPPQEAREPRATTGGSTAIAGYVLVGGASSRFGRDKALVEFGGKPMLMRMRDVLMGVTSEVAIIGDPESYGSFGSPCVADRWPGEGPLGGILTALLHTRKTKPECAWTLIVSCDMPFLTAEWLRFLCESARTSEAEVVLAHSTEGPEPLCACWRTAALPALESAFGRGVRKVTDGIALLRSEVLDAREWKRFDNAGRLFWNMNTRADYEEARRILEAEQS